MSLRSFIIVTLSFLVWPAWSQDNCTVPLPPILNLVSVQPETGKVDITWTPSPSAGIAAYIIYIYSEENTGWMPVDTIWNPLAMSYTFVSNATKYKSIQFVVAAYRLPLVQGKPGCPSELSNSLNTIFISSEIDTCKAIITLKWNNYSNTPRKITGYQILVSEDDGPMSVKFSTGSNTGNFIITDFRTDKKYSFAIRAILEDGTTSTSNKSSVNTTMQKPPEWISSDYISVNDNNKIELSFLVDPESEITRFAVENSNNKIATITQSSGIVVFTDEKADITKVNYYSLSAVNSCDVAIYKTDLYSNIVLSLKENEQDYHLSWNPVKVNEPASYSFDIYADTGEGFKLFAISDTSKEFIIDKKEIMYDISSGEVCFMVKAKEIINLHGATCESISSRACAPTNEVVTVPNIFTPNNDLRNDLFRPVLSFTPSEYNLIISDRQGKVLFETNDFTEEWDGSGSEQGVYLWFLKLKTPSGTLIKRSGTVTVVK